MTITAAGVAAGYFGDNATSATLNADINVTAGQLLVVWGMKYSPSADAFVAGDCTKSSGTATIGTVSLDRQDGADMGGGAYAYSGIWSTIVSGTGTLRMSVGGAAAGSYLVIGVEAFNGSWDASRADGTATGSTNTGDSITSMSSGNITTTGAGLIVGCLAINNGAATTLTPDAAFTTAHEQEDGTTHAIGSGIYRIVSSGTTDAADWTFTALDGSLGNGAAASVAAYKESGNVSVTPGLGALTLTGLAPTFSTSSSGVSITAGLGALTITGYAPDQTLTMSSPAPAALVLTGHAPSLGFERVPGLGQLTLTGFAPTFVATDNKTVSPSLGALTLTGLAPTISATASYSITPSLGQLSLTGFSPTLSASSSPSVFPDVGTLTLTGLAPSLSATDHKQVSLEAGSLTLTGFVPSMSQAGSFSVAAGLGVLQIFGYEPNVEIPQPAGGGGGNKRKRKFALYIKGQRYLGTQEDFEALVRKTFSATPEKELPEIVVKLEKKDSFKEEAAILEGQMRATLMEIHRRSYEQREEEEILEFL